jgi:integrase
MALPSYLSRREGRYYIQVRFSRPVAAIVGKNLYRASLRTADYRQARLRLSECIGWVHRMNESTDYVSLFEKNAIQLRLYLADRWPITDERLEARQHYEELLKNLARRARAAGADPEMIEPDYYALFQQFVRQNVDAEHALRKAETVRHYERGRSDMQAALSVGAIPQSFVSAAPFPGDSARRASLMPLDHANPRITAADTDFSEPPPANMCSSMAQPQAGTNVAREARSTQGRELRFSEALDEYLAEDIENKGNADARSIVKLIVQFIVDKLNDPLLRDFDPATAQMLDKMLPDIPDRNNIPREHARSLAARYDYAQQHGWEKLKRLTEARLTNGYHDALSRFFGWLIERKLYPFEKPVFEETSEENLVSIERDAFKPSEVRQIFSLPLFTGCKSANWTWVSGNCFLQNHLYWGYVISFLAGLRTGEIGRIELDDIEEDDGIYYLQLRGFNPAKGRVARKNVKRFKTQASHRTIPLHPLILDLGLLDRVHELRAIGCPVLFPEWEPYPKPGGEMRWGQPLTKSFQYLKRKIEIERFDVSLYSSRHWFADLIDNTDIKDVTRRRVMGHAGRKDTPARYGRKQRLTTRDLAQLADVSSPAIEEMTEILMGTKERANRGELDILKPWLLKSNWSSYYKSNC